MKRVAELLRSALRCVWRVLRPVLLTLAAIIFWIEEWGWRPLAACAARLAQWPPLARFEDRVRAAPPRVALALFLVPALLLFPFKLAALWLIHQGHALLGVVLIVAAKLLGTALVGRLFVLSEPQLMQFAWFVHALAWWLATKARVVAAVHRSAPWHAAQRTKRWLRVVVRRATRR